MCIAIPGKVLSASGGSATVDFQGRQLEVGTEIVQARPGDYVLVYSGQVMEVIPEERALEILKGFREE